MTNLNQKVSNIQARLSTGMPFELHSSLKRGPVMLNFIAGTWCPMCTIHLRKVRDWQKKHYPTSITLIVTPQPMSVIKEWQLENNSDLLFISDPENIIAREFGVKIPLLNFPMPASFLIDIDQTVKLGYIGFKSKETYEKELDDFFYKEKVKNAA